MDIGSDAGSGSADLIADDRFMLTFEKFDQIQYFNGECNRYDDKFVAGFFGSSTVSDKDEGKRVKRER